MARAAVATPPELTDSPPPEKPRIVEKPPPDPNGPIELAALLLDRPYGVNQTNPCIRVGFGVENGIGVGGLCERITLYPNGTIVVAVRKSIGSRNTPAEERAKFPVHYLVFREGFGEVAT